MSKIAHGVGKVFKKVIKVAKKVLPYALAAAAVVFTGGAALGILPTFAGAIGGLVGSLGISGTLAGALTGSIVTAGFGAAGGFVLGGEKGMRKGALLGAITGGLAGAAAPGLFGIGGASGGGAAAAGHEAAHALGATATSAAPAATSAAGAAAGAAGAAPIAASGAGMAIPTAGAIAAPAAAPSGIMGFLNSNPLIASQALQGIGGALGGSEYEERFEAEGDMLDRERQAAAANYVVPNGGGLPGSGGYVDPTVRPDPATRFNPSYYQGQRRPGRYRYDERTNSVVFVEGAS